jgi:IS1 family transposase
MNRLSRGERAQIVRALVEGNSVRATCRLTGAAKGTVLSLLDDLGRACTAYQYRTIRGINTRRIQCDEIWSFCYAKQKNVPKAMAGKYGVGDVWTWTALDEDSKLIVTWHVGPRDARSAGPFIQDLADRLIGRVEINTDGLSAYVPAVYDAFGPTVDFAQLVKIYEGNEDRKAGARYSPAKHVGTKKHRISGDPDMATISTSHVERSNLTMRMGMRRFTRLTNAFSKKLQNHENAVALHFMYYNFARVHQTLKTTPAMAAGIADHVWAVEEIAALLERPALRITPIGQTA